MRFLNMIFSRKDVPVQSYDDFWNWFGKHEKGFHKVIKGQDDIERKFFDKLAPKLDELKEGFFYLTGMYDAHTVELVLTADGNVRNIVFVEELVRAAPQLKGWKFTALKPASDLKEFSLAMSGYTFSEDNLHFYATDHEMYPDEVAIVVVHDDLTEENKSAVMNGIYIFLDNYLGELDFAGNIDNLTILAKAEARQELAPIAKLKDFLTWRQKEFVEKYEGVRHNTEKDNYACFKAELENGKLLIAVINTDLLNWDRKASHPWILTVELKYDGDEINGMADEDTYQLLDEIENRILEELKDSEGYLNIGRQTADGTREIYFACRDFRKPSKVLHQVQRSYSDTIEISCDIYKDKYWQSFNRFSPVP